MRLKLTMLAISAIVLSGCQNLPNAKEGANRNVVFLKATHCLEEPVGDQDRIHFGPCLKITDINGEAPTVRSDGFIELPVARPVTLGTAEFQVNSTTFPEGGQRWYLHAHEQARGVVGCQPTLSTSVFPTRKTD